MADNRIQDKLWRLNHLYRIRNKQGEMVTFRLNRAQEHFHQNKHNRNIILKSRQLGFTTYEAIDALDDALFVPGTDILMRSYDEISQKDIFDSKITYAWNNFPEELKELYVLEADRANKIKFNWGDGTTSSVTVRLHGRGGTYTRLHVSEFAKICKNSDKDADEVITGDIPAIPIDGGRVDIESTAEEDRGDFHDMFWEAWNHGEPTLPVQYKAHFYNWQWDDAELSKIIPEDPKTLPKDFQEYQKKHNLTDIEITYYYYRWLSVNKSWARLHREYPTTPEEAFEAAGDKFFDQEALEAMKVRPPKEVIGNWRYYADYKPNHRYALAADASDGIGKDNASIVVIDFDAKDENDYTKPEVVAIYENDKIAPDLFAHVVKSAGVMFGNCIAAPERNYPGNTTIAILKDIYYNIFKEVKKDRMDDIETDKLGWHTNMASKPRALVALNSAFVEKSLNVPDEKLLRSLKTYLREDLTNTKDEEGKHWDSVIALSICWQMQMYAGVAGGIKIQEDGEPFDKFTCV